MKYLSDKPIGVFDSGLGGLTVLSALAKSFPQQSWIYLGDTARLPYGSKSSKTIFQYTLENLQFLKDQNCAAFVIACNSASAQYPEDQFQGLPVFKVIKPGAKSALSVSPKKIAVLGTKSTIKSNIYSKELKALGFEGEINSIACPLFVPLVEEGWLDGPVTKAVIKTYLEPLQKFEPNSVILGCTHYSLLKKPLTAFFKDSVFLATSETELQIELLDFFKNSYPITRESLGQIKVFTTDELEFSGSMAEQALGQIPQSLEYKKI